MALTGKYCEQHVYILQINEVKAMLSVKVGTPGSLSHTSIKHDGEQASFYSPTAKAMNTCIVPIQALYNFCLDGRAPNLNKAEKSPMDLQSRPFFLTL